MSGRKASSSSLLDQMHQRKPGPGASRRSGRPIVPTQRYEDADGGRGGRGGGRGVDELEDEGEDELEDEGGCTAPSR
jgi:hypothetical protein